MLLTAVAVVPEHQLWMLEEPHRSQIARGLTWAAGTEAKETNLDTLTGSARDVVVAASNRVRLDLNSPEFQDVFFRLLC